MAAIKSRGNTSTEMAFVKLLKQNKITGWRRHVDLPGKPDFVFRKQRLAIFLDGCFWHCCPKCFQLPKNNRAFWKKKIDQNMLRDGAVRKLLIKKGWRVIRIWEHQMRGASLRHIRRKFIALMEDNVSDQ